MNTDKYIKLLWFVLVALLLVGCENGRYSGTFIFDGQHQFETGAQLPGDVLLRAGTAEFDIGSQVAGTVYVIGGTLLVDGEIGGDLLVLDGRVALGPTAVIGGDLRFSGGTVDQAETAVIGGQTITGLPLPLDSEPQPTGWAGWLRSLLAALTLAGLGGLWVSWRPQPLRRVANAANDQPLVALSVGLLALLVLPILLVMMAFTIVLLPLVLILGLLILLTIGMGLISLGMVLGNWLAVQAGREVASGWATFGGVLLLLLLFQLPLVGALLSLATAVFLFGAVLLTRFGTHRYHPLPPPTDDLATYKRPT